MRRCIMCRKNGMKERKRRAIYIYLRPRYVVCVSEKFPCNDPMASGIFIFFGTRLHVMDRVSRTQVQTTWRKYWMQIGLFLGALWRMDMSYDINNRQKIKRRIMKKTIKVHVCWVIENFLVHGGNQWCDAMRFIIERFQENKRLFQFELNIFFYRGQKCLLSIFLSMVSLFIDIFLLSLRQKEPDS